jgi:hypothetical protein
MPMFGKSKGSGKKWLILPMLAAIALLFASCELLFSETGMASFRLIDYDGIPTLPVWVAFRNGDEPWQRLSAPGADLVWSHLVTDPDGRYAFAVVYPGGRPVHIFAGTLKEIRCFTGVSFQFPLPDTSHSVSGNISGLSAAATWEVGLGARTAFKYEENPSDYLLGVRGASTYDVLATRYSAAGIPDRLWLRRDLAVEGNIKQPIDFADPALSTSGIPLRIAVNGGSLRVGNVAIQASTSSIRSGWLVPGAETASGMPELNYLGLPAGFARASDLLVVTGISSGVQELRCSGIANPPTLDFSDLQDFDSTAFTDGVLSWRPIPGTLCYGFMLPNTAGAARYWVKVTPGYSGDSFRFAIPDMKAVEGWSPAWNFNPGSGVANGTATGGNTSLDNLLLQGCLNRYAAGTRMWWSSIPGYLD